MKYTTNPLHHFCQRMTDYSRMHGWTNKTYQEMIDRLCYLIDNGKSISRTVFSEPISMEQEIIHLNFRGQLLPVAGPVRSSPMWGEAEFINLDSDHYLINIHTNEIDQWTFAGRRMVSDRLDYPILIRTPDITTICRELDLSIQFFEPATVEDDDYHFSCIAHFFHTYADTSVIGCNVLGEFNELQKEYGRPV